MDGRNELQPVKDIGAAPPVGVGLACIALEDLLPVFA
jgi:hypothetical protein